MTRLRWFAVLVLLIFGLASCAGSSGSSGDTDSAVDMAPGAADGGGDDAESMGDGPAEREVITTGSVRLVVPDTEEATDDVLSLVESVEGRVDARSQKAESEYGPSRAWLTIRVPAAQMTGVLADLEELGTVSEVEINTEDVTRESQDLDARISALEASTNRLLDLMAEADSSEALIAAESALSERQAELESLESQRANLADQVAMSTLDIALVTEETAQLETDGFVDGISNGWHALVDFASGLLVGLGTALPWLVVIGIPVVAIVLLLRGRRRRRRRDQDPSTGSPEPVPPAQPTAGDGGNG